MARGLRYRIRLKLGIVMRLLIYRFSGSSNGQAFSLAPAKSARGFILV